MSRTIISPRLTIFVGGTRGDFSVTAQTVLLGDPIARVSHVSMIAGEPSPPSDAAWILRGTTTHDRYTTREEKNEMVAKQAPIGRQTATRSALLLLRKNADWWALAQDERRAILEEQSHHIAIGMRYLPAIARRLLHCRDFSSEEPFDFLGYLDFAPEDEAAFDEMLEQLRATREWSFMDREIDIRLARQ